MLVTLVDKHYEHNKIQFIASLLPFLDHISLLRIFNWIIKAKCRYFNQLQYNSTMQRAMSVCVCYRVQVDHYCNYVSGRLEA